MDKQKVLRKGLIAANVLKEVFADPNNAYAHSIMKRIKKECGPKPANNVEVGDALRFLAADGALIPLEQTEPTPPNGGKRPRQLYAPTPKAAFYLALLGRTTHWTLAAR